MENICRSSGPIAEVYLHIFERKEDEKIILLENLIDSLILILSDHRIRSSFVNIAHQTDEIRPCSTAFAQLLTYVMEFLQLSPLSVKGKQNYFVKFIH